MSLLSSLFGGPRQDIYPDMGIFDRTSKAYLVLFNMLWEEYVYSEVEKKNKDELSYAMCVYISTLLTVICIPHSIRLEWVNTEAHCKLIMYLFREGNFISGNYDWRFRSPMKEHAAALGMQGDPTFNKDQLTNRVLFSLMQRAQEFDDSIRQKRETLGMSAFQDECFSAVRDVYLANDLDKKEAIIMILRRISGIYQELAKNQGLGLHPYELSLFGSLLKPFF